MIERDLFSRSEKARKVKQFSLCTWRWMGKEVQWNERFFGTILLPLLRWPMLDPSVQNCVSALLSWHYDFSDFSEKCGRFSKPFFFLQNPGAPPKNTKMRMGAAEEINLAIFWDPDFELHVQFQDWKHENPFSPQFWAILHSAQKMPAAHPIEPRRRCQRWKIQNLFSSASFWAWCPKTMSSISRTNWCTAEPH